MKTFQLIKYWIFDLDNTLYSAKTKVFNQVEKKMTQYVFLGHDVDWRKQGASLEHIMARKERFESSVLEECDKKNPYYNIPEYMEIEEKFGIL